MDARARRRQTDLRHGRVDILAITSCAVLELTGMPPAHPSASSAGPRYADAPRRPGATSLMSAVGWARIATSGAPCELPREQPAGTAAAAGGSGWKVLTPSEASENQCKSAAETADACLAMAALTDMVFHCGLSGSARGDRTLDAYSPPARVRGRRGRSGPARSPGPLPGSRRRAARKNFAGRCRTELEHVGVVDGRCGWRRERAR